MTRFEECRARVLAYAAGLKANPSAIEGLLRSYVAQPAFDVTFREALVREALALIARR